MMVSGLKYLTKEEIEGLYWQQKLTLSQIGRTFSVTYPTVIYWMKKHGVHTRGVRKYRTKPFDGNELEKAYLIGLRLGDLNVRPHRRQILVRTSTTHPSMLELFRSIFQKYSHVYQFPIYYPTEKRYFWQIYALLDKSFKFMIDKTIPNEITTNESIFYAFLAGYTDAEGCICITPNKDGIRLYFNLASEDSKTLFAIADRLKKVGHRFTLEISKKRGESYRYRYNMDYWQLRIATKADVIKLLERLELRHREKNKWKELVLKIHEVKKWADAKEEVVAYRKTIKEEASKCVADAEEKFRLKHLGKTITAKQTDYPE